MAKRGRKPKEKKNYFCEDEESALVEYLEAKDDIERNRIFNKFLYPALTKMIESIIRRYKLFVPDEDFEQTFSDTISYLLTKINNFKTTIIGYSEISDEDEIKSHNFIELPYDELHKKLRDASAADPEYVKCYIEYNKRKWKEGREFEVEIKYYKKETHHYKAYSYCGTICKNYLMYKCSQYSKNKQRSIQYDDVYDEISNSIKYTETSNDIVDVAPKLVCQISDKIEEMIMKRDENMLTDEEVVVGMALINLLRNWEEVLPLNASNKLQKNSVLFFLREETMMTTKEIRTYMKKYKTVYYLLKDIDFSS